MVCRSQCRTLLVVVVLAGVLVQQGMASCPSDMKAAPKVPGLSGVEVGGDSCVCPAGSYYWRTGFIFCFDKTKSYSDHLTTQDDVAFRVTYGRAYDLVNGWNRYTIAFPGHNSTSSSPASVAVFDAMSSPKWTKIRDAGHCSNADLGWETHRIPQIYTDGCDPILHEDECNELPPQDGGQPSGRQSTCEPLPGAETWVAKSNEDYDKCMDDETQSLLSSGGDITKDLIKRKAKCLWSRSERYLKALDPNEHNLTKQDTDADWRYTRDPDFESDVPGLLRLQHPEIFTPSVATPNCLPCPPCASCAREGTAVIKEGWGMGTSGQQLYNGLLKGTKKNIKTLVNRPGSAALGPILQQETVDLWGVQHQLRPRIQFENLNDNPKTLQDKSADSTVCSYCSTSKIAREEFAAKTAPIDDTSLFRWQITFPVSLTIAMLLWRLRLRLGLLRAVIILALYMSFVVLAREYVALRHAADLEELRQAIVDYERAKTAECPDEQLYCSYSTNFDESVEAVDDSLVFHKTLFECPTSLLCPAEVLYFDDGLQMYEVCGAIGDDPVGTWVPHRLGGPETGQGNWSCSEPYGTCVDAGNWLDIRGRSCNWYAENYCDVTIFPRSEEGPERWTNWTVYSSALGGNRSIIEECAWQLALLDPPFDERPPADPDNPDDDDQELSCKSIGCVYTEAMGGEDATCTIPDDGIRRSDWGDELNPADRFIASGDPVHGIKAVISEMFVKQERGDLAAFASGAGLSALDACCACGGGGTQKEALQVCTDVVIETQTIREREATSELYQQMFADANAVEVIEEEVQISRIATDPEETNSTGVIPNGNAGQEGSLCAGCKRHYIVQADGSCEKCEKQETRGAVWVFIATLVFLILLTSKSKQSGYRTEAIDRAFADLNASENADGKPLFAGAFTSSAKQSDILQQLLRDAKFEGDKLKESLQVTPADVNMWVKLQKPKKGALLHTIVQADTGLRELERRWNSANMSLTCDKILELANKHDKTLVEAALMKKMLPVDKQPAGELNQTAEIIVQDRDDEINLFNEHGTPKHELIIWDKLPGGTPAPTAWYTCRKRTESDSNADVHNHLVRGEFVLEIDEDATKRLGADNKLEVDQKLNDQNTQKAETLYLRYVAAQKWIEANAEDIEKAKQYKELEALPLDELFVRAGETPSSELKAVRETAATQGKMEAKNGSLILPKADLQGNTFRMLPFENGVKKMMDDGQPGLNYDDEFANDNLASEPTRGTPIVFAQNNDMIESGTDRTTVASARGKIRDRQEDEKWSKDGKSGVGVDTFVKHLKARMSINAQFVKGAKTRKNLDEKQVRLELGTCERLEIYRREATHQKMRRSDLLQLELEVIEAYEQHQRKKPATTQGMRKDQEETKKPQNAKSEIKQVEETAVDEQTKKQQDAVAQKRKQVEDLQREEHDKQQKEREDAAATTDADDRVDPGGGLSHVLMHLQKVYNMHPDLDPAKGPLMLVHKAFQFENRRINLIKCTVPVPEVIPKLSVFLEVVLQSTVMVAAFVILGMILVDNLWFVGVIQYGDTCWQLKTLFDSSHSECAPVRDESQCLAKRDNQDNALCEWRNPEVIPDSADSFASASEAMSEQGYCRLKDNTFDMCADLQSQDACSTEAQCAWMFDACTGCSIYAWRVNPWLRAALTPINLLLAWQVIQRNIRYYLRTYAKFLKPLTARYQEEQQRMEKAAQLFGGAGTAAVVISAEESLMDQLKIVTVSFQLMTQLPFVLNFEFPPEFKLWLERLKLFNLDLFGDFSVTCLIDEYIDDFRFLYFKFTVYMMLPPFLIFIVYRGHKSTEAELERAIRRELDEQDSTVIHPPKQPIQAVRLRIRSHPRSTVIRITNRTNNFMDLVKGDTRLVAAGTSGGHLSSTPLQYEDEPEEAECCSSCTTCASRLRGGKCRRKAPPKPKPNVPTTKASFESEEQGVEQATLPTSMPRSTEVDKDQHGEEEQHQAWLEQLQSETMQRKMGVICRVPLLRQLQKVSISALADKLISRRFAANETLAAADEKCTQMFFIRRGEVSLRDRTQASTSADTKQAGQYAGDYELLLNRKWTHSLVSREKPVAVVNTVCAKYFEQLKSDWEQTVDNSDQVIWYWFECWLSNNDICTDDEIEALYKDQSVKHGNDATESGKMHLHISMETAGRILKQEWDRGGVLVYYLEKESLHSVVGISEDFARLPAPRIEGGRWGYLEAAFALDGTFPALGISAEMGRIVSKDSDDSRFEGRRVSIRIANLLNFREDNFISSTKYKQALAKVNESDWDLRQDGSKRRIDWPATIPPRTEVLVVCSSPASAIRGGIRAWLTYRIRQMDRPVEEQPLVRMEVVNRKWALPFIQKSVLVHADITKGDEGAEDCTFYVHCDSDAKKHTEVAFSVDDTSTDVQTDDEVAERAALERMLTKRQQSLLEESKLMSFSRVALILFLMYNALTSNVFGLFACYQMDFGDSYNRFDLELDCDGWMYRNVWRQAAWICMFMYPIGIPFIFAVMLFSNRKVLSRDPANEMSLEDFAQVVEMMEDDPSIKDISTMFEQLDEDRGGTLSLNELRTGAIGMGMSGMKNSDGERNADAKELDFAQLSGVQKTDVRKLLGFPVEDPSVDRLRAMLRELEYTQHTIETIKQCTEDIQEAVNMCILVASVGPPCTAALDPRAPFNQKQQVELSERPLLPWAQLMSWEQEGAQKMGFDAQSWDAIKNAAGDDDDDEELDLDTTKRSRQSANAFALAVAKVQTVFGLVDNADYMAGKDAAAKAKRSESKLAKHRRMMPIDFAFEVPDSNGKRSKKQTRIVDMFEENFPGSAKGKSHYHALAPNGVHQDALTNEEEADDGHKDYRKYVISMFGESIDCPRDPENLVGQELGYHHIWLHRWAPEHNGPSTSQGESDDGSGSLATEWVTDDDHILRYRTAPQVVHADVHKQLKSWENKQEQLECKRKFFGRNWEDLKKLESESDIEQQLLDCVKHLLENERKIGKWTPEGDATNPTDSDFEKRWNLPMEKGRWLAVFTCDWDELSETDRKHIRSIWQANNAQVATDEAAASKEWKRLQDAMELEQRAYENSRSDQDQTEQNTESTQITPIAKLAEEETQIENRLRVYQVILQELEGYVDFIRGCEQKIIDVVTAEAREQQRAKDNLVKKQADELWARLRELTWTQIEEDRHLLLMMTLMGYTERMWVDEQQAPCSFAFREWDDLEEDSIRLFIDDVEIAGAAYKDTKAKWKNTSLKVAGGETRTLEQHIKTLLEDKVDGQPPTTLKSLLFEQTTLEGLTVTRRKTTLDGVEDGQDFDWENHPCRLVHQTAILETNVISKRTLASDLVRAFAKDHWNYLYHDQPQKMARESMSEGNRAALHMLFQSGTPWADVPNEYKKFAEMLDLQKYWMNVDKIPEDHILLRPWSIPPNWNQLEDDKGVHFRMEHLKPLTEDQQNAVAALMWPKDQTISLRRGRVSSECPEDLQVGGTSKGITLYKFNPLLGRAVEVKTKSKKLPAGRTSGTDGEGGPADEVDRIKKLEKDLTKSSKGKPAPMSETELVKTKSKDEATWAIQKQKARTEAEKMWQYVCFGRQLQQVRDTISKGNDADKLSRAAELQAQLRADGLKGGKDMLRKLDVGKHVDFNKYCDDPDLKDDKQLDDTVLCVHRSGFSLDPSKKYKLGLGTKETTIWHPQLPLKDANSAKIEALFTWALSLGDYGFEGSSTQGITRDLEQEEMEELLTVIGYRVDSSNGVPLSDIYTELRTMEDESFELDEKPYNLSLSQFSLLFTDQVSVRAADPGECIKRLKAAIEDGSRSSLYLKYYGYYPPLKETEESEMRAQDYEKLEGNNLMNLDNFVACLRSKVAHEGTTKWALGVLPATSIDALWDSRNKPDTNRTKSLCSFRVFLAKCFRTLRLPPLVIHRTERFWSELTVEQRRAAIRLGYAGEVWDQQTEQYATRVFRVSADGEITSDKESSNPIVRWYTMGRILPCVKSTPKSAVDSVLNPIRDTYTALRNLVEGDRVKYGFLVNAYVPESYYWELIEYGRKFVLSGVLIFIEPGSLTQVFIGTVFSLTYCVVVSRAMPYRDPHTNQTKLVAEVVLSFVFVCTLALRNDLAREYLGAADYTELMIAAVLLGNLVPALLNVWIALVKYFESLSLLQDSLTSGGGVQEDKSASRWKRTVTKLKKLYSFGVQLASAFDDLNDMVSNGYDDDAEDSEEEFEDADENGSKGTTEGTIAVEGAVSEGVRTRGQVDDAWLQENKLYFRDPIRRVVIQKPWKELLKATREILSEFGYDEETWNQEQPAVPAAVANKEWSYFEEKMKDVGDTPSVLYAHQEHRERAKELGFDWAEEQTPHRWRYYMVDKSYSEVVAERNEMMNYLLVRLSKATLEDLWKQNKTREWLNRVRLSRDEYFRALTKAWKACERSAIQHTLEHYQHAYTETFRNHVEAGIQGADPSDFDWTELSDVQRGAAEQLGWDQSRWDAGGLPPSLKDADGKKAFKDLDQTRTDAARLLGYNETTWDQADQKLVMDSTAMRATLRHLIRETQGVASDIKDPTESMEFELLRVTHQSRLAFGEHDFGAVQNAVAKAMGKRRLLVDCWVKTQAVWKSPELMQGQQKLRSDRMLRSARQITPRGSLLGTVVEDSKQAARLIELIRSRRRTLAQIFKEIPGGFSTSIMVKPDDRGNVNPELEPEPEPELEPEPEPEPELEPEPEDQTEHDMETRADPAYGINDWTGRSLKSEVGKLYKVGRMPVDVVRRKQKDKKPKSTDGSYAPLDDKYLRHGLMPREQSITKTNGESKKSVDKRSIVLRPDKSHAVDPDAMIEFIPVRDEDISHPVLWPASDYTGEIKSDEEELTMWCSGPDPKSEEHAKRVFGSSTIEENSFLHFRPLLNTISPEQQLKDSERANERIASIQTVAAESDATLQSDNSSLDQQAKRPLATVCERVMVPRNKTAKVQRSHTATTELIWSSDALYVGEETDNAATFPTLEESRLTTAESGFDQDQSEGDSQLVTQSYRLRHCYPMRKHAPGASWHQTYWQQYENQACCRLCKTPCKGPTDGWYYSPHCRLMKELSSQDNDVGNFVSKEMPLVETAMFDICPECWNAGVKTRAYTQKHWQWLRAVQSKQTWLRLPGQGRKLDLEQPSHLRLEELELELPALTIKELTTRALAIGVDADKVTAATGGDEKRSTTVAGLVGTVGAVKSFGNSKLEALSNALSNAVTIDDFEANARNAIELEMKVPASNPAPVFEVMRDVLANSAVDLLRQLSLFEHGQREDSDVANIAFEVFKAKLSLRATYEIGCRFSEAVKFAGTQLQRMTDDQQSILERKWEHLADDDKSYLSVLGYKDEQSSDWDNRKMTTIACKVWSDPDITADQRYAAHKLRLSGDAWLAWQKNWLNQFMTGEVKTWKQLSKTEKQAAKRLGYKEKDWKNSSSPPTLLKPWGDEREEETTIPLAAPTVNGMPLKKLIGFPADSSLDSDYDKFVVDDPDVMYVDFSLEKTWRLSEIMTTRDATNWSLAFQEKAEKRKDNPDDYKELIHPGGDAIPMLSVEVFLISDGSKIQMVGGEWKRVMDEDGTKTNDAMSPVVKTSQQRAAPDSSNDQDEVVDRRNFCKRKNTQKQEATMQASELWEAYNDGIRIKVKSRAREAYVKKLQELDGELENLIKEYTATRDNDPKLLDAYQQLDKMLDDKDKGKEHQRIQAAKEKLAQVRHNYTTGRSKLLSDHKAELPAFERKVAEHVKKKLEEEKKERESRLKTETDSTDDAIHHSNPVHTLEEPDVENPPSDSHDEQQLAQMTEPFLMDKWDEAEDRAKYLARVDLLGKRDAALRKLAKDFAEEDKKAVEELRAARTDPAAFKGPRSKKSFGKKADPTQEERDHESKILEIFGESKGMMTKLKDRVAGEEKGERGLVGALDDRLHETQKDIWAKRSEITALIRGMESYSGGWETDLEMKFKVVIKTSTEITDGQSREADAGLTEEQKAAARTLGYTEDSWRIQKDLEGHHWKDISEHDQIHLARMGFVDQDTLKKFRDGENTQLTDGCRLPGTLWEQRRKRQEKRPVSLENFLTRESQSFKKQPGGEAIKWANSTDTMMTGKASRKSKQSDVTTESEQGSDHGSGGISWVELTAASEYMQALERLDFLKMETVESGKLVGQDIQYRELVVVQGEDADLLPTSGRVERTQTQPVPDADALKMLDSERREWQRAFAIITRELKLDSDEEYTLWTKKDKYWYKDVKSDGASNREEYDKAPWHRGSAKLKDNSDSDETGSVKYWDGMKWLLGHVHKNKEVFELHRVRAQIHDATMQLSIDKRQWMGDVDHVKWSNLDRDQLEAAKLLKFTASTWNRRAHTPITKQTWGTLRDTRKGVPIDAAHPPSKEEMAKLEQDKVKLESNDAKSSELVEAKRALDSAKKEQTREDEQTKKRKDFWNAANTLWKLGIDDEVTGEGRMQKRWDLLANYAMYEWKDLHSALIEDALVCDIDQNEWALLTTQIKENNPGDKSTVRDLSSYESLFGQGEGKKELSAMIGSTIKGINSGLEKTTRNVLKQYRLSMENTCIAAKKGVARARRSMRDGAGDKRRLQNDKHVLEAKERDATKKLWTSNWSDLSVAKQEGARVLGYRENYDRLQERLEYELTSSVEGSTEANAGSSDQSQSLQNHTINLEQTPDRDDGDSTLPDLLARIGRICTSLGWEDFATDQGFNVAKKAFLKKRKADHDHKAQEIKQKIEESTNAELKEKVVQSLDHSDESRRGRLDDGDAKELGIDPKDRNKDGYIRVKGVYTWDPTFYMATLEDILRSPRSSKFCAAWDQRMFPALSVKDNGKHPLMYDICEGDDSCGLPREGDIKLVYHIQDFVGADRTAFEIRERLSQRAREAEIKTESSFEFTIKHCWSPKPFLKLNSAHQEALSKTFGVTEEVWSVLRNGFVTSEKQRAIKLKQLFARVDDDYGFGTLDKIELTELLNGQMNWGLTPDQLTAIMNEVDVGAVAGLEALAVDSMLAEVTGETVDKLEQMEGNAVAQRRKEEDDDTNVEPTRVDILGEMLRKHFAMLYRVGELDAAPSDSQQAQDPDPDSEQLVIGSLNEGVRLRQEEYTQKWKVMQDGGKWTLPAVKEQLDELISAKNAEGEVDFEELMDWMNKPHGRTMTAKAASKNSKR